MVNVVSESPIQLQLFGLLEQLLKLLIGQSIIRIAFLHVEVLGQHWHIQLLVDCNRFVTDLGCLLDKFILVGSIEKSEHFLVVVLVEAEPIAVG